MPPCFAFAFIRGTAVLWLWLITFLLLPYRYVYSDALPQTIAETTSVVAQATAYSVTNYQTFSTVAGGVGDGKPATAARLFVPKSLAVDKHNTIYIADGQNNRIRKVAANGIITTAAGNGSMASSGNRGLATLAGVTEPHSVAVNAQGELYIVTLGGIRKVTVNGVIDNYPLTETYLGDNSAHCVASAPNGDMYFCQDEQIVKVDGRGNRSVAAHSSGFDVAVDSKGNLYIAESADHRIRKVDSRGVSTILAGSGRPGYGGDGGPATQADLNTPSGLVTDTADNLYIADTENRRVRKIDTAGTITTVAGCNDPNGSTIEGIPAIDACLGHVEDVAVDSSGRLLIADSLQNRIFRVNSDGLLTSVAGGGEPADTALLWGPSDIAFDRLGNLYFADSGNNRIRKIDSAGIISTVAGDGSDSNYGDGGRATAAGLSHPESIALDKLGNLYIADTRNNLIRRVDTSGIIATVLGQSEALNRPNGIAVDDTDNLYITDTYNDRILKADPQGAVVTVANGDGTVGNALLREPRGLALDKQGNLYVANAGRNLIQKIDAAGTATTVAGNGHPTGGYSGDGKAAVNARLDFPMDVLADQAGNVYFTDGRNNVIRRVDTAGIISHVAGDRSGYSHGDGGPAAIAGLSFPAAIALDAQERLYVADFGGNAIRRLDTAVAIDVAVNSGGTVTSSPNGIRCRWYCDLCQPSQKPICANGFGADVSVALIAKPDDGMIFSGWNGDCAGTEDCWLALKEGKPRSVSASFAVAPPNQTLTVGVTGKGRVTSQPVGMN